MSVSPQPSSKQQRLWQRGQAHAAGRQWQQAAECFTSIVAHQPGNVPALLNASDALLRLDRYREARQCALQACAHVAGYPQLLVETCQRLRHLNETAALLALVGRIDHGTGWPIDPAGLTELASLVSSSGDQRAARRLVDRAVQADPGNAQARYLLGVIAMFQGDMDLARYELEACIALAPSFAQAYWVMSSLERIVEPSDQAVDRIRTCLDKVAPWSTAEAYLAFALHNELHGRGRHAEAWHALQRGCEVKRRLVPHDARRIRELFSALKDTCTHDFVNAPRPSGGEGFTPIFIIGMHRSGTTLLERILGGHSQVADGGETYAFTAQLDLAADHKTAGALDAITLGRLAGADFPAIGAGFLQSSAWRARGKPCMTEKLPSNLLNAGLIARALPEARILHMVRSPADTCFSNLRTYFTQAATYSYDPLELADYHAQYRDLMRHWHAVMPGRILDVAYDQLVADTEATARRIFAFCGLPFEQAALSLDQPSTAVSTASSAYVRNGILTGRGAAWKPYEAQLRPMLDRLAEDAAQEDIAQ